jgi:hypothetical protein
MIVLSSSALALILLISPAPSRSEDQWKPVTADDLRMKEPTVEKDADAEILFKEVYLEIGKSKVVRSTYIRMKLFTERGVKNQGTVELPYVGKDKVEQIAGRTIKPDGTIIELRPDSIFDREIVKTRGFKIKVASFAMPALEPGAIIEYRWRESEKLGELASIRLDLQDDVPARRNSYTLKVPSEFVYYLRTESFNGPEVRFVTLEKNIKVATVNNIPASRDEPLMPPTNQVRWWVLVYFADWGFSMRYRRAMNEHLNSVLKESEEVRSAATAIVGDAKTPDQKLERLFQFCASKIRNVSLPDPASQSELSRLRENKTPSDTLRQGAGTGSDVNFLFAALAKAVGLNPLLAQLPERSEIFFDAMDHDVPVSLHFLSASNIAINVGGEWRFFDPASKYVPYGMLRWQEEGVRAMLIGRGDMAYALTPISPADKSLLRRTASLKLAEDGAIEGDVRVEQTGHFAVDERLKYMRVSASDYEESLRKGLEEQFVGAQVSAVRADNAADAERPFAYSYHVKMPGYAQRTGRRLFLKPAFFNHGESPLFSASARKHSVYIQYPWSESDVVTIELPAGFKPDGIEAPPPLKVGGLSEHKVTTRLIEGRRLENSRSFYFGGGGIVLFPVKTYPDLKSFFDLIHERDNQIITLSADSAEERRR